MTDVKDVDRWADKKDTKALMNALNEKDFKIVWRAAKALGEMRVREAVPQLIPLLKHSNRFVRGRAGEALLKIEGKKALPHLRKYRGIFEEEWVIKKFMETAAAYREKWALDYILEFLESFNPNVKLMAYRTIVDNWQELPDYAKRKLAPYEDFFNEDKDFIELSEARWKRNHFENLFNAFLQMMNEYVGEEFPILLDIEEYWHEVENMIEDEDEEEDINLLVGFFTEVQEEINALLYSMDFETLLRAAGDKEDVLHRSALFTITNIPVLPQIEEAVERIGAEDDPELIKGALRFYAAKGTDGANTLIKDVLHSVEDESVLLEAVKTVRKLHLKEFIPELESIAAGDYSDRISIEAIFALGETGSSRAIQTLIKLIEDWRPERREAALLALGKSGHPAAVGPVLDKFRNIKKERNEEVKRACVLSAGRIAGKSIIGELKKILEWERKRVDKEDSWVVMEAVVRAIGEMGGKEAVDFLISCLTDDEPNVSATAAYELWKLREKTAVPELLKAAEISDDTTTRYLALQALCRIGDRKVLPVLKKLYEEDEEEFYGVSVMLAVTLANLEPSKYLQEYIYNLEPGELDVEEVILLSENLTNPEALPVLLEIIRAPEPEIYRKYALVALPEIITDEAVPVLKELLENEAPIFEKAFSVWVLGKLGTHRAIEAVREFMETEIKKLRRGEETQDFPFALGIVLLLLKDIKAAIPTLKGLEGLNNPFWLGFTQMLIDLIQEPVGKGKVEDAFQDLFSTDRLYTEWDGFTIDETDE